MSVHWGGVGPGHTSRSTSGSGGVAVDINALLREDGSFVLREDGTFLLREDPINLATPTLTNSSALGAAPLVLSVSDTDYTAGLYLQLQIDQTSSAFSSLTQNLLPLIDGASWASLDEAIGLATPAGQYWARVRTVRDNDSGLTTVTGFDPLGNAESFTADVSSWSNTFTDTINVSVNVWNGTTGVNKSQYVAISGSPALTVTGTNGVGAPCGVRGVTAFTGKRHFEVKATTIDSGDSFSVGIDDGTTALGPSLFSSPNPGLFYSAGNIVRNGVAVQTSLATPVANDVISVEPDTAAGTVKFFKNGTQLGTTETGVSFSNWYSYCATQQASVLVGNFGQNAFTMTPTSGYTGW